MLVSRRGFLAACRNSASLLGLSALELSGLETLLANPASPTVLWLQGASCSGCSVSFLNYIAGSAPRTAAEVLISSVNLAFHPTLMSACGDLAVSVVRSALAKGGYILVVEGGVPTAFGGATGIAWTDGGKDVTFQSAVKTLAAKASTVLSFGECAAFGGVPAAAPNVAGIRSVQAVTLKKTINVAGCPPHPDWMVWSIVNAIKGTVGSLDQYGRPKALYGTTVHDRCPRKETEEVHTYGVDNRCLKEMGCQGPITFCNCPDKRWNNGVNWCVDANSLCIGCTSPNFPDPLGLRGRGEIGD